MRTEPGRPGRRFVTVLSWFLLAVIPASGGEAADPSVFEDLARIRHLMESRGFKEAEAGARSLLTRLDETGRGKSSEAADTIELLLMSFRGQQADSKEALELAGRALQIREVTEGTETLRYASSLNTYAYHLAQTGRLRDTRPLYEQVLAIRERLLEPGHPDIGRSLKNLGMACEVSGDWLQARDLYERSLGILEAALGMDHKDCGIAMHDLGELLEWLGDYDAERRLYERRLRSFQDKPGVPPALARVRLLCRIAETWDAVGDAGRARDSYMKALESWKELEALGVESDEARRMELSTTLIRLALTHRLFKEIARANDCYLRCIRLRELALGSDHPDIAYPLRDLAILLHESGDSAAARPFIDRACAILGRSSAAAAPAMAECLWNQGIIMGALGEASAALPLVSRSVEIETRSQGDDNPVLSRALTARARLLFAVGQAEASRVDALRAESIARRHFQRTASWLSERQALRFEQARLGGLDLALSSVAAQVRADPDALARVWDAVVRSRALVLDELATRRHIWSSSPDSEMAALVARLDTDRNRVARFIAVSPESAPEQHQAVLAPMLEEKEASERALAIKSTAFRDRLEARDVGLKEVMAALPDASALVAYVKYERSTPSTAISRGVPSYLALVLDAARRNPALVPLGDAERIDALIMDWRRTVVSPRGELTGAAGKVETLSRQRGEELRRAVWDPVAQRLGAAKLVLIVPDGAIHLVNLPALPDQEDGYLVEADTLLHQISAERDLRRLSEARVRGSGLLALGGPDYDRKVAEPMQSIRLASKTRSAPAAALGSLRFDPLPAAVEEAEQIASLWSGAVGRTTGGRAGWGRSTLLTRMEATEGALKSLAAGRRAIHLATHGFFAAPAQGPSSASPDPLLASGLALAGANARASTAADQEDGLLLAEEIASRDLTGVEWVVLSACESALGAVHEGEGVLGMRRAFEAAGAGTLIMSLWPVEDEATRQWMMALYRARLSGLSTAASMRRASVERIEARRARGLSTHPFFWGGFVAAGDWR